MTRLLLVPLVYAILLTLAAPATGVARAVPRILTPEEVRAAFLRAGYLVGEPAPWSGEVSMLAVRRPEATLGDRPLLRVFVFANEDAAASEHRRAHAADEARSNRPIVASDDRGPRLLTGYGASVWRHNVAVVQASTIDDLSAYPIEPDCAPTPVFTNLTGADPTPVDLTLPATGVDPRVVELLENITS
jgi:hypothetical protein